MPKLNDYVQDSMLNIGIARASQARADARCQVLKYRFSRSLPRRRKYNSKADDETNKIFLEFHRHAWR